MNVHVFATDLPVKYLQELEARYESTRIILNQHIYLRAEFDVVPAKHSESITVTIYSQMQTSPPYILEPEFKDGNVLVYHLEFYQQEPLPNQVFVGGLNIVHFNNGTIYECQVPIRVTNPVDFEILGIFHILKQPSLEFRLLPQKCMQIVSLIFQCRGVAQEMPDLAQTTVDAGFVYRYFLQFTAELFEKVTKHPEALNITVMYSFQGQISTIYFNFDCRDWLRAYYHIITRKHPLQLTARLIQHVPQSHCDLEKNQAYYAVSLDIFNASYNELKDIELSVRDICAQVIALTRKIEIQKLESKQTQTVYIELYSYQKARLLPELTISVGYVRWNFLGTLLLE